MKAAFVAALLCSFSVLAVNIPIEPRTERAALGSLSDAEGKASRYYHPIAPVSKIGKNRRKTDAKVSTYSEIPESKFARSK